MDVTLEQEGVSDENMCNGHGTHSLTSVLSRQRGTRRVTVQHLRERHVIVVGQRLRCCMSVVDWEPWHGRRVKCNPTHAGPDPSDPRFVKTTWVPYARTRIFFTCARVLHARTRGAAF